MRRNITITALSGLALLGSCASGPSRLTLQRFEQVQVNRTTRTQLLEQMKTPKWIEFMDFGWDRFIYEELYFGFSLFLELSSRIPEDRWESVFDLRADVVVDKAWFHYQPDDDGVLLLEESKGAEETAETEETEEAEEAEETEEAES